MNNKYLEKVAELFTKETRDDLKNTAGIMAAGTVMGGAANHLNQKLGLMGKAVQGGRWYHPRSLAAAGVAGALGGVADFTALRFHRATSKGNGTPLQKSAAIPGAPFLRGVSGTIGKMTGKAASAPSATQTTTATLGIRG